jgi:subtilase family serine protease
LRVEQLETRTLLSVYGPAQITHAYGIDQISFKGGTVKGDGSGQTIAIVDAYYDPTIASDLSTFNSTFGLAQLNGQNGNGKFTQLDLSNKTLSPVGNDWTVETALDVEWAHAVAPKANILLVEAANDLQDAATGKPTALLNAVHTAATTAGVSTVSMSWGISEVPAETNWDSYFTTPGVTFVAASGDSGAGTIWPSVSPNVVSVGGTTLNLTKSSTIRSETSWGNGNLSAYYGGSGGGFSQYESLPSYQSGITTVSNGWKLTGFGVRLNPDVAYVGNPNTGLHVYDAAAGGWYQVGGTSAGAPQWAALIAIADQGRALSGLSSLGSAQTLSALYSNPADFHDITSGSTGSYLVTDSSGQTVGTVPVRAGVGFDMVTGLGTPRANLLVPTLANATTSPAVSHTAAISAATSSSAASSSKSGSTTTQQITIGFVSGLGFLPFGQPQALQGAASTAQTLPTRSTPPLSTNPLVQIPISSGPTTYSTPPITQGSGGGADSIIGDTSNEDTVPSSMPDESSSDSLPDASSRAAPAIERSENGFTGVPSSREIRDAYFSTCQPADFTLKRSTSRLADTGTTPSWRTNPLAAAAALAVALGGYWAVALPEAKLQERRRRLSQSL